MNEILEEIIRKKIHVGNPLPHKMLSKENYEKIRNILHKLAGEYLDKGDAVRNFICLEEVKRLDLRFI